MIAMNIFPLTRNQDCENTYTRGFLVQKYAFRRRDTAHVDKGPIESFGDNLQVDQHVYDRSSTANV